MIDAKGGSLRPPRPRTKIEQSAPESLTRLPSRFVLIHMWWSVESEPLYSVQPDVKQRRDRNSIANGERTPVWKLIPSCQAHNSAPRWMLDGQHIQRAAVAGVERGLAAVMNCVASRTPWPNGV
jgi:hypothetical protein